MSDESKAVGEVAWATKEFIWMCRDALWVFTEPLKIKKNAEAQAEAILTVKKAELRADREEFAQRALLRSLSEQMYKQRNLETIISEVPKLLTEGVDPYKVSEDWLHRFANAAENCSEDVLQNIWTSLMAQEVNSPSSISYRTIEQVKLFGKSDALLVEKIIPYVMGTWNVHFIIETGGQIWKDIKISYLEWMKLKDIWILQDSMSTYEITQDEPVLLGNCWLLYCIENTQNSKKNLNINLLTDFWRELVSTIKTNNKDTEYLEKIKKHLHFLQLYFNYLTLMKTYSNWYKIYCANNID